MKYEKYKNMGQVSLLRFINNQLKKSMGSIMTLAPTPLSDLFPLTAFQNCSELNSPLGKQKAIPTIAIFHLFFSKHFFIANSC